MKISKVDIRNYRGIKDLSLPLDPKLTVLHGTNGSGKTSIITAIALALGGDKTWSEFDRVDLDRSNDFHTGLTENPTIHLICSSSTSSTTAAKAVSISLTTHGFFDFDFEDASEPWIRTVEPSGHVPRFRFYNVDREVVSSLTGRDLGQRPDYNQLFNWFHLRENEELRRQRDGDSNPTPVGLAAVRYAICEMLGNVSNPRISSSYPPRLVVSIREQGESTDLALEQLSDGYRGVLALTADIAHYIAGNEYFDNASEVLNSEIIVLIDEIELHLHPAWQQRILTDLMRAFPNAQFIVSTHSPQVLTTVDPKHIVELTHSGNEIIAARTGAATYGAEAGDVLECVMGVDERPDNEFSQHLAKYRRLISLDQGNAPEALELRSKLDKLSPNDPALEIADLEIRQRELFRNSNKST